MTLDWPSAPLSELTDLFTDGDWIESKDQAAEGIRLVQTGNVGTGQFKNREDKARFIDDATFSRLNCTEVCPGDVLISRLPDPVGRACRVPHTGRKMITAVDCTIVRPDTAQLDPDFLLYWTQSTEYLRAVDERCTGTTRRRISRKNLGKVPVRVPPLDVQKRIVAVLDQAFAALDRARGLAEANLADARSFFLSALRDVFDNSSKKWNTAQAPVINLASPEAKRNTRSRTSTQTGGRGATTRSIAGDYSLAVGSPDTAPRNGWTWSQLSDLAVLNSGHTPSRKKPEYWGGEISWIGIRDARDWHGQTIRSTREQTNELGIANSSARVLSAGTVCLSRTASVGYVVVMGEAMATSQDFVNWTCREHLNPEFLKFLLLAQGDEYRRFSSGSVHQTIYYPEVKAFHICHPNIETQGMIAASLSELASEASKLEAKYEQELIELSALRQALLQKAFSGQLV